MKKKLIKVKKEKGITLIALVVTIVVLLILAGVTIAMLTGDNGILTQAGKAKEETEIGKEKEIIGLAVNSFLDKDFTKNELKEEIIKNAQDNNIEVLEDGDSYIIKYNTVNRNYKYTKGKIEGPVEIEYVEDVAPGDITKDKNGNILDGTELHPYEINCIEDLVAMSGKTYESKHIKLNRNLDFKSDLSYIDGKIDGCNSIDELKEKLTTGNGYNPIGMLSFSTFDGNNNIIENVYINSDNDEYVAFISSIKNSTIKNLSISGNIKGGKQFSAGIVARITSESNIENCINFANIEGENIVGGIGNQYTETGSVIIKDCNNFGEIKCNTTSSWGAKGAGGICGHAKNIKIEYCSNYGKISSSYHAGGIIGSGSNIKIDKSINYGEISGVTIETGNHGGIVGWVTSNENRITNTANYGNVQTELDKIICGGIVGNISSGDWDSIITTNIENCYNFGNIKTKNGEAGGIMGTQGTICNHNEVNLKNVYNIGNIQSEGKKGTIIGSITLNTKTETITTIENVYYKMQEGINTIGLNEEIVSGFADSKTEEEMKNEEFLNLLNNFTNENWLKWIKGEDGYPIFANEK